MTIDVNKTKEILEIIHPYLRWGVIGMYGLMMLYINRIFIKDPILRAWLLQSLQETKNGGASGKSLSGFVLVQVIVFSCIVAIVYSPNHILPDSFFSGILMFVGSLYGIKVASKYYDSKSNANTDSSSSSSVTSTTSTITENLKSVADNQAPEQQKEEVKKDDTNKAPEEDANKIESDKPKNNPEDIG